MCEIYSSADSCITSAENAFFKQKHYNADSQFLSESQRLSALFIKVGGWAKSDISILSFYKMVNRPVALHVSKQSYSKDPSSEDRETVKHATKRRLSSEQLLFQHVQTRIYAFESHVIKPWFQSALALPSKMDIVYECIICFGDDQLNGAFAKLLFRVRFGKWADDKSEKGEHFSGAHQTAMN